MIKGSIVAIVTPMHEDGSLDLAAFRALIDFHIEQRTDGIVVVGTTGESPPVGVEEQELVLGEAGEMRTIVYTGPGRTVADMSNDTVLRLAQIPTIVGIKDATGDIERGSELLQRGDFLKRDYGDGAGS